MGGRLLAPALLDSHPLTHLIAQPHEHLLAPAAATPVHRLTARRHPSAHPQRRRLAGRLPLQQLLCAFVLLHQLEPLVGHVLGQIGQFVPRRSQDTFLVELGLIDETTRQVMVQHRVHVEYRCYFHLYAAFLLPDVF